MARIRTIKPSFWNDDDVADLSRDARLLALGLISLADDDGRFVASHQAISGYVFPHDNISPPRIQKWLDEITKIGMIELYDVGKRRYGWFPNWSSHQRINRPQCSPLPAPPSLNGSRNRSRSRSVNESRHES